MFSPKAKTQLKAITFALLFTPIVLGWLGLVYFGLSLVLGFVLAALVFILMLFANSVVTLLVAAGFAFWGAYTGLHLHGFYALMLSVPIVPLLVVGLTLRGGYEGLKALLRKKEQA